MKSVFTLVCILSAVHYATAQCSALKAFTTELQPSCDIRDVYIKWPNYADPTTYYSCDGVGNPVLTPCPSGYYFIYVYQKCGSCSEYIPPVQCQNLRTQNTPNCVPIESSASVGPSPIAPTASTTGYPTPYYPTDRTGTTGPTSTSAPLTAIPPVPTQSSITTASTPVGPAGPAGPPVATPPTITNAPGPSTAGFPGPPSPVPPNPNIPLPPTPAPTPPNLDDHPPTVAAASG